MTQRNFAATRRCVPCRRASGAALAFAMHAKTLAACERYERRAFSKGKRMLRRLRAAQRRNKEPEAVGPPRPNILTDIIGSMPSSFGTTSVTS